MHTKSKQTSVFKRKNTRGWYVGVKKVDGRFIEKKSYHMVRVILIDISKPA